MSWKKILGVGLVGCGLTVSLTSCGAGEPSVVTSSLAGTGVSADSGAKNDVYAVDQGAGVVLTDNADSAKVFVTEFTDLQCPACANMQATIGKLAEKYRGTDIAVVVRNFPLQIHDNAQIAAQAAEAAAIQGKYEEYASGLYSAQAKWGSLGAEEVAAYLRDAAVKLDLDIDKFAEDMNSEEVKNRVSKDKDAAVASGVRGTPTLFVGRNEVVVPKGSTYSDVQKLIEKMAEEERGH